jgi:hypothetical protein
MHGHTSFRSHSGDLYWIPDAVATEHAERYQAAVTGGDWDTVMDFETGFSEPAWTSDAAWRRRQAGAPTSAASQRPHVADDEAE